MKTKLLIVFLQLALNTFCSAQSKNYFLNKAGKILDEQTYYEQKNSLLENIKKQSKSMQIVEDLNELSNRNDSIVYSYVWYITSDVKETKGDIKKKKAIIGKKFPIDMEMTLDGKKITLEDLKGKPTLINLWFTSCAPCIEEMPVLNNLQSKYTEKFNFIAITMDSESKVKNFLEKHQFTFTHIVNSKKLTSNLGLVGYPVNLFLDKNGIVKLIEGNVPIYKNEKGELTMSDGMEFIRILENYCK